MTAVATPRSTPAIPERKLSEARPQTQQEGVLPEAASLSQPAEGRSALQRTLHYGKVLATSMVPSGETITNFTDPFMDALMGRPERIRNRPDGKPETNAEQVSTEKQKVAENEVTEASCASSAPGAIQLHSRPKDDDIIEGEFTVLPNAPRIEPEGRKIGLPAPDTSKNK